MASNCPRSPVLIGYEGTSPDTPDRWDADIAVWKNHFQPIFNLAVSKLRERGEPVASRHDSTSRRPLYHAWCSFIAFVLHVEDTEASRIRLAICRDVKGQSVQFACVYLLTACFCFGGDLQNVLGSHNPAWSDGQKVLFLKLCISLTHVSPILSIESMYAARLGLLESFLQLDLADSHDFWTQRTNGRKLQGPQSGQNSATESGSEQDILRASPAPTFQSAEETPGFDDFDWGKRGEVIVVCHNEA
jgi:hypothetical protein